VITLGVGIGCLGMIFFGVILLSLVGNDDVGAGTIFFLLACIVGSAIGGVYLDNKRKDNLAKDLTTKINEIISKIESFSPTQQYFSPVRDSFIAIDENEKKLCFIENKHDNVMELSQTFSNYDFDCRVFSYKDVLQSEILEDDASITRTSRGSQIGGALLGGVLAGGVGAIIGGLSGSQTTTTTVKKIQLQIVVNDTKKSFNRITFASFETEVEKRSESYKMANKEITHWHNLISHLIRLADKVDKEKTNEEQQNKNSIATSSSSIADEIRKLSELHKEGIISDEEFNTQKQKVLSS
jgi:hypothetical protein